MSDAASDVPLLARLPGELSLYIGSLHALNRKDDLDRAQITHVLSVFRPPVDEQLFRGYTHKLIPIDDVEDENILEHLPGANDFIRAGLRGGGGVLVHCVMGKSRSAAIVTAFLMSEYNLTRAQALAQVHSIRPFCDPNQGFQEQLDLYHRMGCPADSAEMDSSPTYQRWLYTREVELSGRCGQAPDADKIRFEDEHSVSRPDTTGQAEQHDFKCRKCRRTLATSAHTMDAHEPTLHTRDLKTKRDCAHIFVDPLSWMRPELEKGELEGRLECPKCKTNVGKYAWQGMRCSCGQWIVPAISLARGRIDTQRSADQAGRTLSSIRLPPRHGSKPSDKGNL